MKRFFLIGEVILLLVALAVLWLRDMDGNYEAPLTLCTVLLAVLELVRRTHPSHKSKKDKLSPISEEIICQKAEAEFLKAIRKFDEDSISEQERTKIDNNINRAYSAYSVLERAVDIRVDIFIMPIVNKIINIESELRLQYKVPMTDERRENLREKLYKLVTDKWRFIGIESFDDSIKHVEQHTELHE